jgi:DNA-binding MarR family transcriptional regulator
MSQSSLVIKPQLPALPCLCSSFRRTARALSQVYDGGLRATGLRITQFTILQVLARAGEVTQGRLGEMLAMDSTSLTRTLGIMRRRGWIVERRGEDQRERWIRLSKAGETKLKRATAGWEKVQARLREEMGGEVAWENLLQLTNQVTGLVTGLATDMAGVKQEAV